MNTVDMILSQIGEPTDGLGPNWSPLERLVHKFHMKDIWKKIRAHYESVVQVSACSCSAVKMVNYVYFVTLFIATLKDKHVTPSRVICAAYSFITGRVDTVA